MKNEDLVEKRIKILDKLSLEEKQNLFNKMTINDIKKIIELVEEGEKND